MNEHALLRGELLKDAFDDCATEDFTEELAMDLLSRVHILQLILLKQLQRAHVLRSNFGDAGAPAA